MIIVYRKSTGEIIDNQGTNSAWPEGPPLPDDVPTPSLPKRPDDLDDAGWDAAVEQHQVVAREVEEERKRRQDMLDLVVWANVPDDISKDDVEWMVLSDDSAEAQATFTHEYKIKNEKIVKGKQQPEPEVSPDPKELAREDLVAARDADTDTERIKHLTSALERLLG